VIPLGSGALVAQGTLDAPTVVQQLADVESGSRRSWGGSSTSGSRRSWGGSSTSGDDRLTSHQHSRERPCLIQALSRRPSPRRRLCQPRGDDQWGRHPDGSATAQVSLEGWCFSG